MPFGRVGRWLHLLKIENGGGFCPSGDVLFFQLIFFSLHVLYSQPSLSIWRKEESGKDL